MSDARRWYKKYRKYANEISSATQYCTMTRFISRSHRSTADGFVCNMRTLESIGFVPHLNYSILARSIMSMYCDAVYDICFAGDAPSFDCISTRTQFWCLINTTNMQHKWMHEWMLLDCRRKYSLPFQKSHENVGKRINCFFQPFFYSN